MAAFSHTTLAGSSWLQRRLPQETKYELPESIAETRALLHLLDGVTHARSPTPRFLQPSAAYFRSSVNSGGRALQSNRACAALLLADTNEDYIAQAVASAATFAGSWDMRGGDTDALSSLERTVLRKKLAIHERLRMMPDALAAVINGCVKAVARARQCRTTAAVDDSQVEQVARWTLASSRFRASLPLNRSLHNGAAFCGPALQPLQLKQRRLSATKSKQLAAIEFSGAMVSEHIAAFMNNIRCLRHVLGRAHAEGIWELVGAEAAVLLRCCSDMKWIPEAFAIADMFCSHTLSLLRWSNSSPAFWQPFSDTHVQPLLQFCSEVMTHAADKLAVGAAYAVRSCSLLLIVAISCLSRSWQRMKLFVDHISVQPRHAAVLVKACARLCSCVNAARSCSNMSLLVSLVTSLSPLRLLLECVWTLVASALQLRSHVASDRVSNGTSGTAAAETWTVACTQTTSFLLLLHAPARPELIALLLYDRASVFASMPCGASREEMLHSATVHQRSALTLAHCLDHRGPMAEFQRILSNGDGISLQGRFCIMCTVFGLHAWALQPPPTEICDAGVEGISCTWSLTTSPVLFSCGQHLSLLHHCALAAVSSACRVNVSLLVHSIAPSVLQSLCLPPTATVCRDVEEDVLPVVDVAALCFIICCDGGCNWMFANEERLGALFEAMRRTLQFALSPTMAQGSLTKIVIHAFAVLVSVLLEVIAPTASSSSQSRRFLRNSLQLPSLEQSSVQYMKHAALTEKIDRHLGRVLCACIRAMRCSPLALGETEVCVVSSCLMAARDAGGSCLAIVDSAWPLLARIVWRASMDGMQFVESLCDISCVLKEKRPSKMMCVNVSAMGILLACVVLELRDANFTANQDVANARQAESIRRLHSLREMFPVDLNPISISSTHVAPYVRALVGRGKSRIPAVILLTEAADDAVTETLQLPPVQQEVRDAVGAELNVRDMLGEVAVVFSKLPDLLQFIMSRVVRKIGMQYADAAAEVCRRALDTAVVMSCDEWVKCSSMASQVIGSLGIHAIAQAMLSDADPASGVYGTHLLPPVQLPPELREEAERKILEKERPNMKVRLKSLVVAAADGAAGAALTLQAHSAVKANQSIGRARLFEMLNKLYPHISTHQQHLKVVALSGVRAAWIERALLPLWVSVRVMKTQASGKTSRRRTTTLSDRGLLPALLQSTATSMFDPVSNSSVIDLLNKFPAGGNTHGASDSFKEFFMNIVTLVLNEPQQLPLFLISLKAVVNQMLPVRPSLISNCVFAMSKIVEAACALPSESQEHPAHVKLLETFMQNTLMLLPGMFAAAAAAIDASHHSSKVDTRVIEVLSNPAVSERWRLLEAQHLRKLSIKDLILPEDAGKWTELFLQLLDFTEMIQRKQLNLTSGVLQVMIMACSCQVDAHTLSLSLVSAIVASFSSVVASAPCFHSRDSIEFLRAAKWTDVAVALDIIGNLLGIIVKAAAGAAHDAASAIGHVKTCFENMSKLCLCFPATVPSDHAVAHVACWSCLSNCCTRALQEGRKSFSAGFILELLQQIDVLFLLLTSKKYAIDLTGGKLELDTDEVLYRVLCLPDDCPELDDDADMVSRVRLFIKDCSSKQVAEQLPRVLMDPVERWLEDLMNLNIENGLDAFNATSFIPPLLDWQMEAIDLNAALSAAIKDMGQQLLMLRPAVFRNPFESGQADFQVKIPDSRRDDDECRSVHHHQTASEDFWQPRNPWSAAQHVTHSQSTVGDASVAAERSPRSLRKSARESEGVPAAVVQADAQAATDKVFSCVKKRVVTATRELIADKMRRMQPPQWLHPCVEITNFVFKMCEQEPQRKLRKEFLQSDVRLLLYAIYTRFEAEDVGRLAHSTLKLLAWD